nr:transposase [Tateyamaria pelophila]
MRVRLENEIRGLLKTFGIMFGKRVGGFKRRAEEIVTKELVVAPELIPIFEALIKARHDILAHIAALDSRIRVIAKSHKTVRLLMTAPGVGPITAMAVVAAFDDIDRFKRSSSAGAYLGLTPKRYESGEISRNLRRASELRSSLRVRLCQGSLAASPLAGWYMGTLTKGDAEQTSPDRAGHWLRQKNNRFRQLVTRGGGTARILAVKEWTVAPETASFQFQGAWLRIAK